jgi:hypothetical protein
MFLYLLHSLHALSSRDEKGKPPRLRKGLATIYILAQLTSGKGKGDKDCKLRAQVTSGPEANLVGCLIDCFVKKK